MPRDVVVRWEGKVPTSEQLGQVLDDYLRGVAVGPARWDKDRFFAYLPGVCGHPLRRVLPKDMAHHWKRFEEEPWQRWIEVRPHEDCVYVMTRHADEITNVIADGFAKVIARWWSGKVES